MEHGGAITPKITAKVKRAKPLLSSPSKSLLQKRKNSPMAKNGKSLLSKSFQQKDIKNAKVSNTPKPRLRTSTTVSKNASTSKLKEKKKVPLPDSAPKSVKKEHWKKRPKPAHSGVPLPERMKKFITQGFQDADCNF